ncbi:MAG: alkyl sulfatase dimerization domain-containing protein [Promethearchaeota archaeon]
MVGEGDISQFFGMFEPAKFGDGNFYHIGAFGNVGLVVTSEGLVLFDVALEGMGSRVFKIVRSISDKPVKFIVISHGHFDHGFGFKPFYDEIKERGWKKPTVIAHANILRRYEKYNILDKYHAWLNTQQFSSIVFTKKGENIVSAAEPLNPDVLIRDGETHTFRLGRYTFQVHPEWGETDDALWMFCPEQRAAFLGDLFLYSFPNVGNPYKVQRYPRHWAKALERILEKEPEYLSPGHGRLVAGRENVAEALRITADALNFVHDGVVKRMNEGKWFEQIFHEMMDEFPERFKESPYLQPVYGCFQYAIHCTYRLYHGWYDSGNPTDLYPEKRRNVNREVLDLIGTDAVEKCKKRALTLIEQERFQLALHVVDIAIFGLMEDDPGYSDILALKIKILRKKEKTEPSLISSNIMKNHVKELRGKIKKLKKK